MFAMTSSLLYATCALVNVATAQARNFSESASNDGMYEQPHCGWSPWLWAQSNRPPLPNSGRQSLLKISLDVVDVFQAH